MFRISVLLIVAAFIFYSDANAQLPVQEFQAIPVNYKPSRSYPSGVPKQRIYKIPVQQIDSFVRSDPNASMRLVFPGVGSWTLKLHERQFLAANFSLNLLSRNGPHGVPIAKPRFYEGWDQNQDYSATIVTDGRFLSVTLSDIKGTWFFHSKPGLGENEFVVDRSDEMLDIDYTCGDTSSHYNSEFSRNEPGDLGVKDIAILPITALADFSLLRQFRFKVDSLAFYIYSNLFQAERFYQGLNFDSLSNSDSGAATIRFRLDKLVFMGCNECDVIDSSYQSGETISAAYRSWIKQNIDHPNGSIYQYWTARPFYHRSGNYATGLTSGAVSCDSFGITIFDGTGFYGTNYTPLIIAHETGHALGCAHDEEYDPSVTQFVMSAAPKLTADQFSKFNDFRNGNYSASNQIKKSILNLKCRFDDSILMRCREELDPYLVRYPAADSVRVQWNKDVSSVHIKLFEGGKLRTSEEIQDSGYTFYNLKPCIPYEAELASSCSNDSFATSFKLFFSSSTIEVKTTVSALHDSLYDLELEVTCERCALNRIFVTENKVISVVPRNSAGKFLLRSLFADGATHKVWVSTDSSINNCRTAVFYKAPYYRQNAKNLLDADFNNSMLPVEWELAIKEAAAPAVQLIPKLSVISDPEGRTEPGTIDSTVMFFSNSFSFTNLVAGTYTLTSGKTNLSNQRAAILHFDYNWLAYKNSSSDSAAEFKVEGFDGLNWTGLFHRSAVIPSSTIGYSNIWDSMPARVFIRLDQFHNSDFKIRFTVDDHGVLTNWQTPAFLALDNVAVDDFEKDRATSEPRLFPNPASDRLYLDIQGLQGQEYSYAIYDISGRVVQTGRKSNNTILLEPVTRGFYILNLRFSGKSMSLKFVRY